MSVDPVVQYQPYNAYLYPTPQIKLPVSAWMMTLGAADIPEGATPWMLAQGWQIASVDYDQSTNPPTPYYNMTKQGMFEAAMLQSLVNTYTNAYNEANYYNALRYEQILANWSLQISQCVQELDKMAANTNAHVSLYLSTLDSLMGQVDTKIAAATSTATGLINYATNLGTAELARINLQFDNLLAKTRQELASRGFYSSALVAQADAGVEDKRSQAILDLNDRINREKVDIEKFSIQAQQALIGHQLEANLNRLRGLADTNAKEQQLYKYMVDTTNGIILGLFGFQERRNDVAPSLEVIAGLCSQLGNSGSTSWVSP